MCASPNAFSRYMAILYGAIFRLFKELGRLSNWKTRAPDQCLIVFEHLKWTPATTLRRALFANQTQGAKRNVLEDLIQSYKLNLWMADDRCPASALSVMSGKSIVNQFRSSLPFFLTYACDWLDAVDVNLHCWLVCDYCVRNICDSRQSVQVSLILTGCK